MGGAEGGNCATVNNNTVECKKEKKKKTVGRPNQIKSNQITFIAILTIPNHTLNHTDINGIIYGEVSGSSAYQELA